ncbi:MAG: DUF3330 domain-containing protein [Caldimonas sp.]
MTSNDPLDEGDQVTCSSCGCEVPLDEAVVPEGVPYVVNFCGLDCYEKWRLRAALVVDVWEGGHSH